MSPRIQGDDSCSMPEAGTATPGLTLKTTDLLAPQNFTQFFEQRAELRQRRRDGQRIQIPSVYPGLQRFLLGFIDPHEVGIKFPHGPKQHILSTRSLNERIAGKRYDGFLSNLELHHHHARNYHLYYCNRYDVAIIYPYLDFDNENHAETGDASAAVRFLKELLGIVAFDQPTARGHGLYPKVDIGTALDFEIRETFLRLAAALTHLLDQNGYRAKVEAKALPSIRLHESGLIADGGRGILGRLPLFECEEEFHAFRDQKAIDFDSIKDLLKLLPDDAKTEAPKKPDPVATLPTPSPKPRKAPKAKGTQRRPLPTPTDEPNARSRMFSNAYEFCRIHRRPPTVQELLDFYCAGPSAHQDHASPDRVYRATTVANFMAVTWKDGRTHDAGRGVVIDVGQYADEIRRGVNDKQLIVTVGTTTAKRRRTYTMTREELGVVLSTAIHNHFHNANHRCPRNAIKEMWDRCQRKGMIVRAWRNEYYQAALEILIHAQLLLVTDTHTKPSRTVNGRRISGEARLLSPGPACSRYPESRVMLESAGLIEEMQLAEVAATEAA